MTTRPPTPREAQRVFCGECGTPAQPGTAFCGECGSRLELSSLAPAEPASRAGAAPEPKRAPATAPAPVAQAAPAARSGPPPAPRPAPPAAAKPAAAPAAPRRSRRARRWLGFLALVLVIAVAGGFGIPRYAAYARDRAEVEAAVGNFDAALSRTNWIVRLGVARDVRVYAVRGQAFAGLGQHDRALASFHDAGLLTTTSIEAKLLALQARRFEQSGDLAAAIRYYGESVRVEPREPRWLVDRAIVYARSGANAEAAADYRAALQLEPGNAAAAAGLRALGAPTERPAEPPPTRIGPNEPGPAGGSEGAAQTQDIVVPGAIGEDREMVWTYVAFGDSLAARGDLAAAEALFRRAIAEQPQNARAFAGLAGVLLRQGHREEAIVAAREARRLGHPGDHWVFRELGL